MGKFKVSFTTALFVFSFVICVIVAVAFVDRAPRNDYDSFYENDQAGEKDQGGESRDAANSKSADWGSEKSNTQAQNPVPPPTPDESNLADLPIDPRLVGSAQPVPPGPAAPTAVANPMAGQSPEEIARALMHKAGVNAAVQAAGIPGMAVPPGISTPTGQPVATPVAPQATASIYLPMQSNVHSGSGAPPPSNYSTTPNGFSGSGNLPSVSSNFGSNTNATNGWNPVQAKPKNPNMIGIRGAPSNGQEGMMISSGRTETGVVPPPGMPSGITTERSGTPAPGGLDQPLLLPPQGGTNNKWELPPAPTLRPPPVREPDRRRSSAEEGLPEAETPDSLDPEGSSGQALAVSGESPEANPPQSDMESEPGPEIAARVNDKVLTTDQAVKLAEVRFILDDKVLDDSDRTAEAKKAAEQWADITATAQAAREADLSVGVSDIERYAAMRPDFDPAAWQSAMADKGFSETEIRNRLKEIALSERFVEQKFSEEFEEDAVREAYEKRPSRYATSRQVHLMELYMRKPDSEKRAEKVEREMRRLQRQASDGTDFGLLARQASQSATRSKGGNLGWITPSKEGDKDRDKAIADLKPGQVSDVIDEAGGYRIYKLVDVKEATDDFEGGKGLVVAELKESLREECYTVSREKLESDTEVNDEIKVATAAASEDKSDITAEKSDQEMKDEARHARAQAVLAEARARKQQQNPTRLNQTPYTQQLASKSQTQQSGSQHQLLYAPGANVQQMAGGQPAPVYQPGGRTPAPTQNALSPPAAISVNYSPGETMHVGGSPQPGTPGNPAANPAVGRQTPAAPTPQVSRNNGWVVTKNVVPDFDSPPTAAARRPDTRAVAQPAQTGSVPPGFEGNIPATAGASNRQAQPEQESEEKRGIVGSVKSFFGGLRR